MIVPRNAGAHQVFETTAVAVAGVQKGAFYGAVTWGWNKRNSDDKATLVPFQLHSKFTPSAVFREATELWNDSKTSHDAPTIDLPIVAEMFTNTKKVALMETRDKGKHLATLDINTRVEVINNTESADKNWRNVVVVSGPSIGKVGWIKQEFLSDKTTEMKRAPHFSK